MRFLVLLGQRARFFLAGLDIRLVERVDADDRASHRHRDLPAEEFLTDMRDIRHADPRDWMACLFQCRHGLTLRRIALPVELQIGKEPILAVAFRGGHRLVGYRDQPKPALAGLSARSCSSQAPRSAIPGEAMIVTLSRPKRVAATPMAMPSCTPGFSAGGTSAPQARRIGCASRAGA